MAGLTKEDEILQSLRLDGHKAFSAFFDFFYPQLVVFSYQLIRNEAEAQEIAADALFKLHKRLDNFNINPKGFLYIAVRNASFNYLKKIKTEANYAEQFVTERFAKNEDFDHKLREEQFIKLDAAIERLPERSKQVIEYLFVQKLPYQQVADLMGTKVKTVENQRDYALKKLKRDLSESQISIIAVALFIFFLGF